MERTTEVSEFMDNMSKQIFGITLTEAINKGICIQCKENALDKTHTEAGIREYHISGMCEECFDAMGE